ncbi:hypothetical protein [Arthrobacter sp. L77]|nr:hypothetical protein [Arthrobacter sp. L77]
MPQRRLNVIELVRAFTKALGNSDEPIGLLVLNPRAYANADILAIFVAR